MNVQDLLIAATARIEARHELGMSADDAGITIVTPVGWKAPKGFPRRSLLQVKENGDRVSSINAVAVIGWLFKNGLIKVINSPDKEESHESKTQSS